jgi:hypothetical protein
MQAGGNHEHAADQEEPELGRIAAGADRVNDRR